jgi:hypothetical protein
MVGLVSVAPWLGRRYWGVDDGALSATDDERQTARRPQRARSRGA